MNRRGRFIGTHLDLLGAASSIFQVRYSINISDFHSASHGHTPFPINKYSFQLVIFNRSQTFVDFICLNWCIFKNNKSWPFSGQNLSTLTKFVNFYKICQHYELRKKFNLIGSDVFALLDTNKQANI